MGIAGPTGARERHHLEVLVLLACACFATAVVETEAAVFVHAEPERLEVLLGQKSVLILEMPGDDEEVVFHDIELVQDRLVRISDICDDEVLLRREKGFTFFLTLLQFLAASEPRSFLQTRQDPDKNLNPPSSIKVWSVETGSNAPVLSAHSVVLSMLCHNVPFFRSMVYFL
jgi:hypothetical protein